MTTVNNQATQRSHLLATLVLLALATPIILGGTFVDFSSYIGGVQRAFDTGSPYPAWQFSDYLLNSADKGRGFVYPPTALPFLAPFAIHSRLGVGLDYLGLLAMWEVVWRILRPGWWGVPLAVVVALNPLTQGALNIGQVTPFIAAGFGLMYLYPRAAGWVGVVGGMVKVLPGVAIVWALRKRQSLLGPILLTIAVTAAVAVWLGPAVYVDYLTVLRNGEPGCHQLSFACAGLPWLGYLDGLLLAVAAWRVSSDEAALALLGWATVIPAPDPYPHYLLVPLVASLPLLHRAAEEVSHRVAVRGASRRLWPTQHEPHPITSGGERLGA